MKRKCEICKKPYKNARALRIHQGLTHKKNGKPAEAEIVPGPLPAKSVVSCQINYCPHCGKLLPNAIIVR